MTEAASTAALRSRRGAGLDGSADLDRRTRDPRGALGHVRQRRRVHRGAPAACGPGHAAADPAQVAQLELVLGSSSRPLVNLALAGGPRRSRRHVAGGPRALPARLGRLAARPATVRVRGVPQAVDLPRLRGSGRRRSEPAAARIGYAADPRPSPPSRPRSVPTRPAVPTAPGDAPVMLDADVVVVGSGAGGGVVAAACSGRAGRSVVVLEAGPFADERTMPTDELDAFDRHYLNHGLLATWDGRMSMLVGERRRRRHARQLDDQHRAPRRRPRRVGDRPRLDGTEARRGTHDLAAVERGAGRQPPPRASRRRTPRSCAAPKPSAGRPARRGGTPRTATTAAAAHSGACGARSSRASGSTSPAPHAAGARIVPRALRAARAHRGRARGRRRGSRWPPEAGEPLIAGSRAARCVVLAAGRPADARAILRRPGSIIRRSAGTCGCIRSRSSPAGSARPVDMWRGTMQGARSLEFGDASRAGTGTPSRPRRVIPGLLALALPWEGRAAHEAMMAGPALFRR